MKTHHTTSTLNSLTRLIFRALLIAAVPVLAHAAKPGNLGSPDWLLSDAPLFLGTAVPANILFVIDDSESMDYETMTRDTIRENVVWLNQPNGLHYASSGMVYPQTGGIAPVTVLNADGTTTTTWSVCWPPAGGYYGYYYGVDFQDNQITNAGYCVTASDYSWRFRSSQFNTMYFNPNVDYTPWAGTAEDGLPFPNANITAARSKPWYKLASKYYTINLTTEGSYRPSSNKRVTIAGGFRFYTWEDTNGNGLFDNPDPTKFDGPYYGDFSIFAATSNDVVNTYSIGSLTDVQAKVFGGRTAAQVQQNFANWFEYYRGRDLLAKGAFGKVIDSLNEVRMGLVTIHNNNVVNTPLELINQTPAGIAAKKVLLDRLYQFEPNGYTPLRSTYKQVGRYMSGLTNSVQSASAVAPLPPGQGGECQQNFALILTDGSYDSGYTNNNPAIPNADGDATSAWDGGAYADPWTDTLADIAMYYYENDIIPTTDNAVPTTPPIDYNNAQHLVTFAIAFGPTGSIAEMPADDKVPFNWPSPHENALDPTDLSYRTYRIDDLRHAAYNGRGEFLAASNPTQLVGALKHMMDNIRARTSASSALSFNTTTVRTDTLVFQARYNTGDWTGDLNMVPFKDLGKVIIDVRNAGYLLTSRLDPNNIKPGQRNIITTDAAGKAYPFLWSNLTATQQSILVTQYVLNWIRGDQVCEQTNGLSLETDAVNGCVLAPTDADLPFRQRSRVLGDIVNSAAIHVGPPKANYPFAGYADYVTTNATRKPVVYVSSNDGMIHGFDSSMNADGTFTATTGREVLAFLPDRVYPTAAAQANPAYSHRFTLDGSPSVGDAYFQDVHNGAPQWNTVLVTGSRTGLQAYYALNITEPSKFATANANDIYMWEFSDKNDPDMGFSFGKPAVVRLSTGVYGVLLANGLNSTAADGIQGSGEVVLYVVNIADGSIIKAISTKGYNTDNMYGKSNGMTALTPIDIDFDYVVDMVYGTDIAGNLWRFDLYDTNPVNWDLAFGGLPLFTGVSVEGNPQPITTSPALALHPTGTGFMVFFGTGKYIEAADNDTVTADTQSFYGIWDRWPPGADLTGFATITRANLLQQTIVEELMNGSARVTSDLPIDWALHSGWFIDLVNPNDGLNHGERVVTDPVYRSGQIIFTTMIPGGKMCEFGGTGWLMILSAFSGARSTLPVFDTNNDGMFTQADLLTSSTLGDVAISGAKSTHGIPSAPALITSATGAYDSVLINFSDGSMGGTGTFSSSTGVPVNDTTGQFDQSTQVPPSNTLSGSTAGDNINIMAPTGRLIWQRLK